MAAFFVLLPAVPIYSFCNKGRVLRIKRKTEKLEDWEKESSIGSEPRGWNASALRSELVPQLHGQDGRGRTMACRRPDAYS